MTHNFYESPLSARYASQEMSHLFSPACRYSTWRKLWIELAKAQKNLGLPIKDTQIQALEEKAAQFDWSRLADLEKTLHHDVMAHIHAFGEMAPTAKGILHLGATSCYVTDNGDLIIMRDALGVLRGKLLKILRSLSSFAEKYTDLATVGFTHFQPAQPTTVGKRACLWLQDFLIDLQEISRRYEEMPFLGVKGATGTQASFLALFDHDPKKVHQLDELVAKSFGFTKALPIASQTYTRKIDLLVLDTLGSFAASAHKFATDIRLLAHLKEIEEPFGKSQVGSSAMPHKRNPMYCERICGLARFLLSLKENPAYTLATQWLERSLDDSANRRMAIPEAFLTADALCDLLLFIISDMKVNRKKIAENLEKERPLLVTEEILMAAVKRGGERQELHERLRAANITREEGGSLENFLNTIASDQAFSLSRKEVEQIYRNSLEPGLAALQVSHFLKELNDYTGF